MLVGKKKSATPQASGPELIGPTEMEKQYDAHDQASAEEEAEKVGCTVLYSTDHTIQVDIDNDEDLVLFWDQWQRLQNLGDPSWGQADVRVMKSKSGHDHVLITRPRHAPPLTIEQRIMFQALLGSDRVREMLNYTRHFWGAENPIRLFRPKDESKIPLTPQESEDLPW